MSKLPTGFYPSFNLVWIAAGGVFRTENVWAIGTSETPNRSWSTNDFKMFFANRRDCEIAIQSLDEAGIVDDEGIMKLTDDELKQICCRDLLW